jgi:hypothetical protein
MKNSSPTLLFLLTAICLALSIEAQAQVRPALVGNGPEALINLISAEKIASKGGGDALVMFQCFVKQDGHAVEGVTFRESANSKPLASEIRKGLEHCRFMPAQINGKPIAVMFAGTAVCFMADGKPHLRIFANQNADDVKQQRDFIAPQLILGTENWPAAKQEIERYRNLLESGFAEASIDVDTSGVVKDIKIISEKPRNLRFGVATIIEYQHARFIPGFRNGKPVSCNFVLTALLRASEKYLETGLKGSLIPDR